MNVSNTVDFLIVTGMSGAGKTKTINTLEDLGFFCADNILPQMLEQFYSVFSSYQQFGRLAVVMDIRTGVLFGDIFSVLSKFQTLGIKYKLLFLDADDNVLLKRYKESRRRHPLSTGNSSERLEDLILQERGQLSKIKAMADFIIDTTVTPVNQLKIRVTELFTGKSAGDSIHILLLSFGYKNGLPPEADIVIDVRCLKNPFYVDEMREKTGLELDVSRYVLNDSFADGFVSKILDFLEFSLPSYANDGKSQVVIGIGCTGGRHRSVAVAELLKVKLSRIGIFATTVHRDMTKPNNI